MFRTVVTAMLEPCSRWNGTRFQTTCNRVPA